MTRRKFVQYLLTAGALSAISRKEALGWVEEDSSLVYRRNDRLPTILSGYRGNPMREGRFLNLNENGAERSFGRVLKWFLSRNPQKEEKRNDNFRPAFQKITNLDDFSADGFIWLGHSSFLFHLGNQWILTDPCFTDLPFNPRRVPIPLPLKELSKIDYLLISHGHYDHLDNESVGHLISRKTKALVPLEMGALIRTINRFTEVQEAGWYQEYQLEAPFRIYFLPARHWHLRVPWDRNKILWGSFLIDYKGKKFYFAGDSAYDDHFQMIHRLFGPVDYGFLPIGAYKPEYIMQTNHMDPSEALHAFTDLHGKFFIPAHYGTYDLADEPPGEPLRLLQQFVEEKNMAGSVIRPAVGEFVPIEI